MSDFKPSVPEAAAFAVALRAANHVTASGNALIEFGHQLDSAGLIELTRDLAKVEELHRLCAARLAGIVKRLGEGGRS